jgi:YidC/Oxa1 family membrane protein insertase
LEAKVNRQTKWLWALGALALLSVTGCGMYPAHPGDWPHGIWGSLLKAVSDTLDFFAHYTGLDYGLSLLIVTVLVRLLIFPLMVKQLRSAKAMQEVAPKVQQLRSKYKGDPKKIQEETMKLYQTAGVNPMAGCLPMVLQLPILYALYGAIYGNVALNQSTFLGLFNLGKPDHTWILPVLAAVTTYFSSKVMMMGQDQQQKMMLYIMPVFILFIAGRFPSGLALYWIYSNVFTTAQSYFIHVRPRQAAAAAAAAGNKLGDNKIKEKKNNVETPDAKVNKKEKVTNTSEAKQKIKKKMQDK